jgi:hypothetical protein
VSDYEGVLQPLLDAAKRDNRHLRMLYELGPGFTGFTPRAALLDARMGFEAQRVVDRCAVVTDADSIRRSVRFIGSWLSCSVKVFAHSERRDAIEWLNRAPEAKGLTHRVMPQLGVILVRIEGIVRSEDFEALESTMNFERTVYGTMRGLVVQPLLAPRWENVGALLRHVSFIGERRREIDRVAFVIDGPLGVVAAAVAQRLLGVEARNFRSLDLDTALFWASPKARTASLLADLQFAHLPDVAGDGHAARTQIGTASSVAHD